METGFAMSMFALTTLGGVLAAFGTIVAGTLLLAVFFAVTRVKERGDAVCITLYFLLVHLFSWRGPITLAVIMLLAGFSVTASSVMIVAALSAVVLAVQGLIWQSLNP